MIMSNLIRMAVRKGTLMSIKVKILKLILNCFFISLLSISNVQSRVIGIVLDDSGSMDPDYWKLANLSVQYLVALQSEQDNTMVYLMNGGQSIGNKKRWPVINYLKNQSVPNGGTIDISPGVIKEILKYKDKERWFVFISDAKDIDTSRAEYAASLAAKNEINSIFISIGSSNNSNIEKIWERTNHGSTIKIDDGSEIKSKMIQAARTVTSRAKGDVEAILKQGKKQNKRIYISDFPLRRLSVFSERPVIQKAHYSGQPLEIENFPLEIKEHIGHVSHIKPFRRNAVIPAGEIDLILGNNTIIDPKQLLPEVALDFQLKIVTQHGKEIKAERGNKFAHFCYEDDLFAEISFTQPNGTYFSLPDPKLLDVDVWLGKDKYSLKSANLKYKLKTKIGKSALSIAVSYPGYFQFKSSIYNLDIKACRSLTAKISGKKQIKIDELEQLKMKLQVLANGKAIPSKELNNWEIEVLPGTDYLLSIDQEVAGIWNIFNPYSFFNSPCFETAGVKNLELRLYSTETAEQINIKTQWEIIDVPWQQKCLLFFVNLIFFLMFLILTYGLLRKNRFGKRSGFTQELPSGAKRTLLLKPKFFSLQFIQRFFIPFWAEEKILEGLYFQAGSSSAKVLLLDKSLSKDQRFKIGYDFYQQGDSKSYEVFDLDVIKISSLELSYKRN